jgi:cell division septum initiation protein DivIVA
LSDIYFLIDQMERQLTSSTRVPLSAFLIVNEDDMLDVIDQMRTAIPQAVRDGERIQVERNRIVNQAEDEAERLVQEARSQADGLTEEHELVIAAEQKSKTIIERARREAQVLKSEADEYARRVLLSLDEQLYDIDSKLDELQATIRNGLASLSQDGDDVADEQP